MLPSNASLLAQSEQFNSVILGKTAEFWEEKHEAMKKITKTIRSYEDASPETIAQAFTPDFFNNLRQPIRNMVADLRSQQVKELALLLSTLAEVAKDHLKLLLRDTYVQIFDGIKVPHKLMSGYVDESILCILRNGTFKFLIPALISEINDSKAGRVRERFLDYLNEIIIHWDITDKEFDSISSAILLGIQDSSQKSREIARLAYLNLYQKNPQKAVYLIKRNSPTNIQKLLTKAEKGLEIEESAAAAVVAASAAIAGIPKKKIPPKNAQPNNTSTGTLDASKQDASSRSTMPSVSKAPEAASTAVSGELLGTDDEDLLNEAAAFGDETEALMVITDADMNDAAPDAATQSGENAYESTEVEGGDGGEASSAGRALPRRNSGIRVELRSRRQSHEEVAAETIQAAIRGGLIRRGSPKAELAKSFKSAWSAGGGKMSVNKQSSLLSPNREGKDGRITPTGSPSPNKKSPSAKSTADGRSSPMSVSSRSGESPRTTGSGHNSVANSPASKTQASGLRAPSSVSRAMPTLDTADHILDGGMGGLDTTSSYVDLLGTGPVHGKALSPPRFSTAASMEQVIGAASDAPLHTPEISAMGESLNDSAVSNSTSHASPAKQHTAVSQSAVSSRLSSGGSSSSTSKRFNKNRSSGHADDDDDDNRSVGSTGTAMSRRSVATNRSSYTNRSTVKSAKSPNATSRPAPPRWNSGSSNAGKSSSALPPSTPPTKSNSSSSASTPASAGKSAVRQIIDKINETTSPSNVKLSSTLQNNAASSRENFSTRLSALTAGNLLKQQQLQEKQQKQQQMPTVSVSMSSFLSESSLASGNTSPMTKVPAAQLAADENFARPMNIFVGSRVGVNIAAAADNIGKAVQTNVAGTVKYVGLTSFAPGYWLGIELDSKVGKNNGSVQGVSYFKCVDGYGLFSRTKLVTLLPDESASKGVTNGKPSLSVVTAAAASASASANAGGLPRNDSVSSEMTASTVGTSATSSGIWSDEQKLSSLLKIKIAKMMFLLNKQLEVTEEMEAAVAAAAEAERGVKNAAATSGATGPTVSLALRQQEQLLDQQSAKFQKAKKNLNDIILLENKCAKDFKARLDAL